MNSFAITDLLPTKAAIASFAAVMALLMLLAAPFALVAFAAGGSPAYGSVGEKPMCYAAGVGCRPGPSLEIALFAPRN